MKKFLTSIILFFSFSFGVLATEFDVTTHHVILYNMNDLQVLYEENADEMVSIASLTKIMTTVVALENIDDLDTKVEIVRQDFYGTEGYSEAGFKIHDVVTIRDLLYGIMLPSGADAVNAVVRVVAGSEAKFVDMMNKKAEEIGLSKTRFANPVGKDNENNYSSAKDVAKLLQYALKNDAFKKIFTTKYYKVPSNGLVLKSTLSHYSNFDTSSILGSKSGFTKKAGRCLASISHLNGVDYLLVVINADLTKNYNAVKDSLTIYDYYSSNYSYQQVLDKDKVYASIPVVWGKDKIYEIKTDDVSLFLKNDVGENLLYKFVGVSEITNKIKENDKLGEILVLNGEDLVYSMDVYLNEALCFYHPFLDGVIIVLVLVVMVFVIKLMKKKNRWKNS